MKITSITSLLTCCALLLGGVGRSHAQEDISPQVKEALEGSEKGVDPTAKTNNKEAAKKGDGNCDGVDPDDIAPQNVYAKFESLDLVLEKSKKIDWKAIYEKTVGDVDSSKFKDVKSDVPFLMGVRMADGLFSVKIRSKEELNKCADDIRDFARKLGVAEKDLSDAEEARQWAVKGQWMQVVANLGFIQMRVIQQMKSAKATADQRRLILLGGWIEGARIAANGVLTAKSSTNLDWDPSYSLRDPLLVCALIKMLDQLGPEAAKSAPVVLMKKHLPRVKQIVDISIDPKKGKIPAEQIEELVKMATEVLQSAVK